MSRIYFTTEHSSLVGLRDILQRTIESATDAALDRIAESLGIYRFAHWTADVPHVPKTIIRRENYQMLRTFETDEDLRARCAARARL